MTTDDIAHLVAQALEDAGLEVAIIGNLPGSRIPEVAMRTDQFLGAVAPDAMRTQFSIAISYTE